MSKAAFMRRPLGSYDRAPVNVAGADLLVAEPGDTTAAAAADSMALALWTDGAVTIYRNPHAWPRAFLCPQAKDVANDEEALQSAVTAAREAPGMTPTTVAMTTPVRAGSFVAPGFLWRIVELFWRGSDGRQELLRTGEIKAGGTTIGTLRHAPLRVDAEIEAPSSGWLVLLDQDYPGWKVTVDANPAHGARAFGLYRAVPVESGRHTVSWTYRPLSFALGLALALPAIALAALGTMFALFRAITRREPPEVVESS
jgi:hypothetical protein